MDIRRWSLPSRCWVTVIAVQEDWATVVFPDGSTGTVPIGTLTESEPHDG